MSTIASSLLATTAQFLAPNESEGILGDIAEAGETPWQALRSVASLLVRRQVELWRTWHPWLAGFGLTLPLSFVLMGCSVCSAPLSAMPYIPDSLSPRRHPFPAPPSTWLYRSCC
jgi:hypothetical protein